MGTFAQAQSIPQNQFITKDELMELAVNTNGGQGLLATGTDTDVKLSLVWGSRGESVKYYKTYHDEGTAPAGPLVWWVAGAEDADSLVLMTQEPLLGTRVFQESVHDQTFYGNPGTQQVYANHWGASALRRALYRAKPFAAAEQNLRKRSTTTTYDVKNDADYKTVDFLYAPAAESYFDAYITVGESDQLRVFNSYWKGFFWLRSPFQNDNALALVAQPNHYVSESYVYTEITNAVTAAAKMDMTSVLFASAASGSQTGRQSIANDAPLALRLDGSQKNLGSAGVTGDQVTAWAENAQGSRLMVQGNGFSYAMGITSNELVTLTATHLPSSSSTRSTFR